jgi:hypothetical protein
MLVIPIIAILLGYGLYHHSMNIADEYELAYKLKWASLKSQALHNPVILSTSTTFTAQYDYDDFENESYTLTTVVAELVEKETGRSENDGFGLFVLSILTPPILITLWLIFEFNHISHWLNQDIIGNIKHAWDVLKIVWNLDEGGK